MNAIITVTLNPALDFSTEVAELRSAEKLRCDEPSMFPGGGGVNVARAIWNLGGSAKACVALGGPNGQALELLMRAEGVDVVPITLDVNTRHSMSVREKATGEIYRFMLPGTPWTQLIEAHFLTKLTEHLDGVSYCVLSGSMPPGTGIATVRRIRTICQHAHCKLVVDTSGSTLRSLAQEEGLGVDILRMDEEEAQESTNQHLETPKDFAAAARRMIERGAAHTIVMGLGATGNLVVSAGGDALFSPSPKVEKVSRVGAGDSFVGAMVLALSQGQTLSESLIWGNAAASSAVTQPGTGLCQRGMTEQLAAQLSVEKI